MDNECISYETKRFYQLKMLVCHVLLLVIGTAVIILFGMNTHNASMAEVLWLMLMVIPLFYRRSIQDLFSTNSVIVSGTAAFEIREYSGKDNSLVNDTIIAWGDIKSYNLAFSTAGRMGNPYFTYLTIHLRNGDKKRLCFRDEKDQSESLSQKSVFSVFYFFVKRYNSDAHAGGQILYNSGFMATKSGIILIGSVVLVSVAGVIVHYRLWPDTFYFSMIACFFLIIGLIVSRTTSMRMGNTLSRLKTLEWSKLKADPVYNYDE